MALTYSSELKNKIKFHGIENASYIAMADLMLLGWTEKDAYILAFSPEMSTNDLFVSNRVKAILKMPSFTKYLNAASLRLKGTDKKEVAKQKDGEEKDFTPITKEEVLKDLQYMLKIVPHNNFKERSDLLKSIADLMRFKDDIVEGTNDARTYYLPRKCYSCEWYKGREKDKIK